MRSPGCITNNYSFRRRRGCRQISLFAVGFLLSLFFSLPAGAQKLSILTPEKNSQNVRFVSKLRDALEKKFTVIDDSLSEAAYSAVRVETPFNMPAGAAQNIGAAIGCDYFVLVKTTTQRRTSLEKSSYYESSAAVFIVSSRTGRLVYWRVQKLDSEKQAEAERLLANSAEGLISDISARLREAGAGEMAEKPSRKIEEMPPENSPEAKSFRPPIPYKRIKPEYTGVAYLYAVAATVDILLDLDEKGNILRTEIVRWAGYGLDEAVTDAVRKMNWRPAERAGKPLPLRVLLRYNFKKVEKEEE
jgi:hypothetical protein